MPPPPLPMPPPALGEGGRRKGGGGGGGLGGLWTAGMGSRVSKIIFCNPIYRPDIPRARTDFFAPVEDRCFGAFCP